MRLLTLPERPLALLFDLDSTLYSHPAYAAFQTGVLVERLARERGESVAALEAEFARRRAEREAAGLGRTSLGNLFLELGVDIPTSVRWREELIDPAAWLARDPRLDEALAALAGRFALALVTNNPRSVGEKSLEALGVRPRFPVVIGLDDTFRSKPDPAPYALAAKRLGVAAEACVSVGDRHDVDLAPALALGMGAILVESVEDVYALPAALRV